jgi:uncharacterized protein (TIGR03663 family)
MKRPQRWLILFLTAVAVAVALRLPRLDLRPMHGDEAIHAVKFGDLLEKGSYVYDPNEYHGPTLNFFTLVPAWLGGANNIQEVTDFTFRIVPVFFGVLTVLLLWLLADGLGKTATIIAAVFTAISPAFVFYSRYYIQEMLLVCFTLGIIACGYRYLKSRKVIWACLTGISMGLCHATKETCIIVFASIAAALVLTFLIDRRQSHKKITTIIKPRDGIIAIAAAVIVSALFYSSFFTNPTGVLDSIRTYLTYFDRGSGNSVHIHPWYYYLKMLIYWQYTAGPIWTEAVIILLAAAGIIAALVKKFDDANIHLLRFITFYTLIVTVVYSVVPYKTPWCLLGFHHGMILLAGIGAVAIVRLVPKVLPRLIIVLLLVATSGHLLWQSYLGNYKYYANSCNPYVYAHPTTDVYTVVEQLEELAQVHKDGKKMQIHFICPGCDYWPFPWYLRSFPNIGYWTEVTDEVTSASVIIASEKLGDQIIEKLDQLRPPGQKELYMRLFEKDIYLRPQNKLQGYIPFSLWNQLQQYRAGQTEKLPTKSQ